LHYMPLFREQFMIVVSPDHPLAPRNETCARMRILAAAQLI
jgi:DNA-binding transcriptional LysR family regulator